MFASDKILPLFGESSKFETEDGFFENPKDFGKGIFYELKNVLLKRRFKNSVNENFSKKDFTARSS